MPVFSDHGILSWNTCIFFKLIFIVNELKKKKHVASRANCDFFCVALVGLIYRETGKWYSAIREYGQTCSKYILNPILAHFHAHLSLMDMCRAIILSLSSSPCSGWTGSAGCVLLSVSAASGKPDVALDVTTVDSSRSVSVSTQK